MRGEVRTGQNCTKGEINNPMGAAFLVWAAKHPNPITGVCPRSKEHSLGSSDGNRCATWQGVECRISFR